MTVIAQLKRLSSAEEFFDYLDVPYDPAVLNVSRLHVLRLVGNWLAEARDVEGEEDAAIRARFRDNLSRAYTALMEDGPLAQRLFKVHRDARHPAEPVDKVAFVPLSELQPRAR